MTDIQRIVVQARKSQGYEILGRVQCSCGEGILLTKGRHTMVVNVLGYDEHVSGRTYKVENYECSEFI